MLAPFICIILGLLCEIIGGTINIINNFIYGVLQMINRV